MYQDPQVLTVHLQRTADVAFVAFVEKQPAKNFAIFFRKFGENAADLGAHLLVGQGGVGRDLSGFAIFHGVGKPGLGAVDLEEHVGADGIYEGAEGFGIFDAGLAEGLEDSKEGFLDDILDLFGGTQTRTQLDSQQFAEVRDEITFDFGVGMGEPAHVFGIETLSLHNDRYYTART